jgi:CheY-like chemotaxis protein
VGMARPGPAQRHGAICVGGNVRHARLRTTFVLAVARAVDQCASVTTQARRLRLLVVEDDPDTVELLASLLELRGHQVAIATTVEAALALAGETTFDLVVSDVGLPDATGYDLMRTLLERAPIKGIAMSGWGRPEDIEKSRAAGFVEHLTKPVALKKLEQAIERVLA